MLFFHFFAQKFAKTSMFIIPLHRNSEKPPGDQGLCSPQKTEIFGDLAMRRH